MWIYKQITGQLYHNNTLVYSLGYSGQNKGLFQGRNNPAMQHVHNVGPIPVGLYIMLAPVEHTHMGPLAIPLYPDGFNEMFGRDDFFAHGDNANHDASEGCVILDHVPRVMLSESIDRIFVVV